MGDPLARLKERGDCPVRTAMGDHGRSPGITPPGHREAQEVILPIPGAECAPLTNLLTPEHSSPAMHVGAMRWPWSPMATAGSGWGRCSM
jgi:hypothetical protein